MVLILEPFFQKKTILSMKWTMFDQIIRVKLKIKEKDEGVMKILLKEKKWMTSILLLMLIGSMTGCRGERGKLIFGGGMEDCVLETQEEENDLYDGSIAEADVFMDIPNLRQYGTYTCGTTCVQKIMNWLKPYEGDINLTAYEEELGTTEEAGTSPQNILKYFEKNSIVVNAVEKWTIKELVEALNAKHPMLMCIQAWSSAEEGSYNVDDPSNQNTYLTEGHWVICVGYKETSDGYLFYFNDPACVGYCVLDGKELDRRWIDMDIEGKVYDHYGIEIEASTDYDPYGAYHLD